MPNNPDDKGVKNDSISPQEFGKLIESYSLKETIAVAVSGGADSMALVLLMNEWAKLYDIKIIGLTVDHQLRPESKAEADQVHDWLSERKIDHHTLVWQHGKITSALQKKAREARYQLLLEWCHLHKINTLMTAHQLEDQWETFMMRLSKGSGLNGLCCIQSRLKEQSIEIIRPLLTISRERLKKTLKERFSQDYVQDPSNLNTQYERIRWRQLLPILAKEELTPDAVSLTIERFQLVNDYIQKQTEIAWNECVVQRKVDLKPFKNLHPEIAHRILTKMLLEVGGHAYPLSYQSLKGLYDKIIHSGFIGATGGGCYLKKIKGGWVEVRKEERGETLAKSFLLIWK